MQKFLASLAALSALAALSGCATEPAAQSERWVEKEYTTASRLPVRPGSKVDKSKMTEAERDEIRQELRRMSEATGAGLRDTK